MAEIQSKQGLNDKGLATLFKITQMTSAMEWQDEIDKTNVALMGLSDSTKD